MADEVGVEAASGVVGAAEVDTGVAEDTSSTTADSVMATTAVDLGEITTVTAAAASITEEEVTDESD